MEVCSPLAVIVHALSPVLLAGVTGFLAIVARRQRKTDEAIADVREHQGEAADLIALLEGRANGG